MEKRILYFYPDNHRYTDDANRDYISVTTLIDEYVPKFDKKKMAREMARRGKGIYKGKSTGEIINMWNDITENALDKGNRKHNRLEENVKDTNNFNKAIKTLIYRDTTSNRLYTIDDIMVDHSYGSVDLPRFKELIYEDYPKIYDAIKYYVDRGYKAYPELGIYNSDFNITGLIDLPLVNFDLGKFVVLDWKTNKHDMKFESGYYKKDNDLQYTDKWVKSYKHFLAPLDGLEYCTGNKYSMQLSTYSRLLEYFGFTCEGIILVHIRDAYVLNKYGMPFRDETGDFIVDTTKKERVELHWINYMRQNVNNMINHYYNKTVGAYNKDNYRINF